LSPKKPSTEPFRGLPAANVMLRAMVLIRSQSCEGQ
jgi:hypothetical protein